MSDMELELDIPLRLITDINDDVVAKPDCRVRQFFGEQLREFALFLHIYIQFLISTYIYLVFNIYIHMFSFYYIYT